MNSWLEIPLKQPGRYFLAKTFLFSLPTPLCCFAPIIVFVEPWLIPFEEVPPILPLSLDIQFISRFLVVLSLMVDGDGKSSPIRRRIFVQRMTPFLEPCFSHTVFDGALPDAHLGHIFHAYKAAPLLLVVRTSIFFFFNYSLRFLFSA